MKLNGATNTFVAFFRVSLSTDYNTVSKIIRLHKDIWVCQKENVLLIRKFSLKFTLGLWNLIQRKLINSIFHELKCKKHPPNKTEQNNYLRFAYNRKKQEKNNNQKTKNKQSRGWSFFPINVS